MVLPLLLQQLWLPAAAVELGEICAKRTTLAIACGLLVEPARHMCRLLPASARAPPACRDPYAFSTRHS